MVKKYTKQLSFNNWDKDSNKVISDIVNTLILFQLVMIPAILSLPIDETIKLWINSIFGVISASGKFVQKLTTSENVIKDNK